MELPGFRLYINLIRITDSKNFLKYLAKSLSKYNMAIKEYNASLEIIPIMPVMLCCGRYSQSLFHEVEEEQLYTFFVSPSMSKLLKRIT